MSRKNRFWIGVAVVLFFIPPAPVVSAQGKFTIEQVLSAPFVIDLVSAKDVDRIAWMEFQMGVRNVFTAAGPDFKPKRLTSWYEDDGTDLSDLRISDDGSVAIFVRGHTPNRNGWIANPSSFPDGADRAIWAVKTTGGAAPWRVIEGSGAMLSPNGKWILVQNGGEIYEVPVEFHSSGTFVECELKPLFRTHGRNSNYRWSPNSNKIAFVSNRTDHSYIGIYDHETRKISYLSPAVDRDTSPSWSADGKKIAFIRQPGATFAQIISSAEQGATGRGITRRRFLEGQTTTTQTQTPMVSGPGFQQARFRDGHTLTFWMADLETGEAYKFWHNPDDQTYDNIRSFEWVGDSVVFQLERNNWRHYYSVQVDGDTDAVPVDITPGEGLAEFTGLARDGRYLYYCTNVNDIDRRHLWKTPTSGGRPVQLTKGDSIETSPAALASGDKVAVIYSDAKRQLSVALVPADGGNAEIIAPKVPDEFPLEEQVIPENVILTADDGLQFHNQVFVPKDMQWGDRRPALLFMHGGPRRQMLLGYHYMYFYNMAYAINQYFCNQGYVVMSVNYRTGIGYGQEFRHVPDCGSRGSAEYQDVLAAGKYLQSRPDVDPERVGLWGLSYGGILTAMGLSRNSEVFAAGVDIAGVHLRGRSLDPENLSFQSSAVATIDKWTSPVLLVHGDDDRNVNFSQTTGLVQLLRPRDIHYELIVFPDEVHDFLVFGKWLITFNAADDFFRRFLIEK